MQPQPRASLTAMPVHCPFAFAPLSLFHPTHRDAKKMSQPGNVGNLNKEAVRRFKNMSADTAAAKVPRT